MSPQVLPAGGTSCTITLMQQPLTTADGPAYFQEGHLYKTDKSTQTLWVTDGSSPWQEVSDFRLIVIRDGILSLCLVEGQTPISVNEAEWLVHEHSFALVLGNTLLIAVSIVEGAA